MRNIGAACSLFASTTIFALKSGVGIFIVILQEVAQLLEQASDGCSDLSLALLEPPAKITKISQLEVVPSERVRPRGWFEFSARRARKVGERIEEVQP